MFWMIIGGAAAALTTFSFLPQIFKVLRNKSARDVSIITLVQLAAGVTLWVIYGVYRKDVIIIAANAVTLASLLVLIHLYFAYGRKPT